MSDSTDLESVIADAAAGPKRVKGDAGEVEQQPLPDLIAADKYLAAKVAAGKKTSGVRFTKLVPPGAV